MLSHLGSIDSVIFPIFCSLLISQSSSIGVNKLSSSSIFVSAYKPNCNDSLADDILELAQESIPIVRKAINISMPGIDREVAKQRDTINDTIKTLQDSIAANTNELNSLTPTVMNYSKILNDVSKTVDSFKLDNIDVKADVREVKAGLKSLEAVVSKHDSDTMHQIGNIIATQHWLIKEMDSINSTVSTMSSAVDNINSTVSTMSSAVDNINSTVSTMSSAVDNINSTVSTMSSAVDNIGRNISTIFDWIKNHTSTFGSRSNNSIIKNQNA